MLLPSSLSLVASTIIHFPPPKNCVKLYSVDYISKDPEQKDVVISEANGLLKKVTSFEITFYLLLWNDILDRFNAINHLLQNPKMVTALLLLNYLFEMNEIHLMNTKKRLKKCQEKPIIQKFEFAHKI